jgi:hypothetical protein
MITLEAGTRVGARVDENLLEAEEVTGPSRSSVSGATQRISVAAAVMLAGSASQTSWVNPNKSTEYSFPGKPVAATSVLTPDSEQEPRLREVGNQGDEGFRFGKARSTKMKISKAAVTDSVIRLIRAPFVGQLLSCLNKIEGAVGDPRCAAHIDKLFVVIQTLSEVSPYDPYVRVLLAFYDSLAFRNRWCDYSAREYKQAYEVLNHLAEQPFLNESRVGEAIMELEKIGFSTLPFEMSVDADDT